MNRRDRLGRRIGYNWWRELIVSSWTYADLVWQQAREAVTGRYETEDSEFAHQNPRPTLKMFMIQLSSKE